MYKLNFYIEAVFATGANNCVLSLLPWKTKIIFAGGTFFVNVSFFVSSLAFLKIKELLRFVNKFDKPFVFLLSFVNVL